MSDIIETKDLENALVQMADGGIQYAWRAPKIVNYLQAETTIEFCLELADRLSLVGCFQKLGRLKEQFLETFLTGNKKQLQEYAEKHDEQSPSESIQKAMLIPLVQQLAGDILRENLNPERAEKLSLDLGPVGVSVWLSDGVEAKAQAEVDLLNPLSNYETLQQIIENLPAYSLRKLSTKSVDNNSEGTFEA